MAKVKGLGATVPTLLNPLHFAQLIYDSDQEMGLELNINLHSMKTHFNNSQRPLVSSLQNIDLAWNTDSIN